MKPFYSIKTQSFFVQRYIEEHLSFLDVIGEDKKIRVEPSDNYPCLYNLADLKCPKHDLIKEKGLRVNPSLEEVTILNNNACFSPRISGSWHTTSWDVNGTLALIVGQPYAMEELDMEIIIKTILSDPITPGGDLSQPPIVDSRVGVIVSNALNWYHPETISVVFYRSIEV